VGVPETAAGRETRQAGARGGEGSGEVGGAQQRARAF